MLSFLMQSGAPGTPVVATLAVFVVVGAFGFVLGVANLQSYRVAKARAEVSPGDVSSGAVAVSGTVEVGDETLVAPLSGEECVAYYANISQEHRETDGDRRWRSRMRDRAAVPFVLADDTGEVGVKPDVRNLTLSVQASGIVEPGDEPPERVQQFVDEYDFDDGPAFSAGPVEFSSAADRYRYVEKRMDVDGEGYAAGTADPSTAVDGVTPTITNQRGQGFLGSNAGATFFVSDGTAEQAADTQLKTSLAYIVVGGALAGIPASLLYGWFA